MTRVKSLLALLVSLATGDVLACSVPPPHLFQRPYSQVLSTPSIVLARAVSKSPDADRYFTDFTFRTLEVLKGKAPGAFDLTGFSAIQERVETTDFDGHRAPEFWAGLVSFSIQPGDCNAYGVFEVGHDYLIFLRQEPHERAFEAIKSEDDFWLEVVKSLIQHQSR